MLTLTLDGHQVDLPEDSEVALTLWAHDLRSNSTREATFSETFTLPPSARNARALDTPHVLAGLSDAPYRKVPAVLSVGGGPLTDTQGNVVLDACGQETTVGGVTVLEGVAILEQTADAGYDVTLYASTGDLFALVKGRKLRELDLSALDHVLSYANVQAAQANAYTQGYTYPLADDGRLASRRNEGGYNERLLYYELAPFVYYHALLRQLVTECLGPDWALAGSVLAEDRYRRIGFPRARPWPALRQSTQDGLQLTVRAATDFTDSETGGASYFPLVPFGETVSSGAAAQWSTLTSYVVPSGLPADVQVNGRLLVSARSLQAYTVPFGDLPGAYVRIVADPNGTAGPVNTQVGAEYTLFEGFLLTTGTPIAQPARQYLEIAHAFEHLPPGSLVAIQLRLRRNVEATVHAGSTVSFAVGERTYVGGPVQLDAGLPDISQADFLQLLANQFQAVFQPDPVTRTLRVDVFNDLDRNRGKALDWTGKLDRTSGPATTFRLDGYAQRNRYAYDKAPSAYKVLLRTDEQLTLPGLLRVADTTLEDEADAYTAPVFAAQQRPAFNATAMGWLPMVSFTDKGYHAYDHGRIYTFGEGPVLYNGRYWTYIYASSGGGVAGRLPGSTVNVGGTPVAVWAENPESDALNVDNDDMAAVALLTPTAPITSLLVQSDGPAPGGFTAAHGYSSDGLDWGTDLLPAYYPVLSAMLDRARVLRVGLSLHAGDVSLLDHLIPVRLQVPFWPGVGAVDGLFYVNLVDQLTPGIPGPVAVELIRMGDPVPGLAPAPEPLEQRPERPLLLERGGVILLENNDVALEER